MNIPLSYKWKKNSSSMWMNSKCTWIFNKQIYIKIIGIRLQQKTLIENIHTKYAISNFTGWPSFHLDACESHAVTWVW